jgi:ABC-type transporter Mla subunit MlaD
MEKLINKYLENILFDTLHQIEQIVNIQSDNKEEIEDLLNSLKEEIKTLYGNIPLNLEEKIEILEKNLRNL